MTKEQNHSTEAAEASVKETETVTPEASAHKAAHIVTETAAKPVAKEPEKTVKEPVKAVPVETVEEPAKPVPVETVKEPAKPVPVETVEPVTPDMMGVSCPPPLGGGWRDSAGWGNRHAPLCRLTATSPPEGGRQGTRSREGHKGTRETCSGGNCGTRRGGGTGTGN